eukprot:maker-scaffold134_size322110-snap-gene-2.18 protein:Tk07178 transcript:maker-scaffold134_size322110-snap-gene-2.18-mRNA-1 annotation:"c1orf198 homolog"
MSSFGRAPDPSSHPDPFESYVQDFGSFTARKLLVHIQSLGQACPNWSELSSEDRRKVLDREIVPSQVTERYSRIPADPLPGHVQSVFPRLRMPTGLKTVTIDDAAGSTGEDLDSASSSCTYTFHDEHSGPFSWRTKSQQDLRFEAGRPASMTSEELNESGMVTLTTSPSRILAVHAQDIIRSSKGNPVYAKPVQIPVVPHLPKPTRPCKPPNENVPPEQINNFVYENEANKLVLDFGEVDLNGESIYGEYAPSLSTSSMRTSSPDSTKSSRSLISKVKRSMAPTLRRRRKSTSHSEVEAVRLSVSKASTISHGSVAHPLADSGPIYENPTRLLGSTRAIVKPSVAPPPPPPNKARAPEPPSKNISIVRIVPSPALESENIADIPQPSEAKVVKSPPKPPERRESLEKETKEANQRDSGELDDFKIDLTTSNSALPKTGFDFLDNCSKSLLEAQRNQSEDFHLLISRFAGQGHQVDVPLPAVS